MKTNTMPLIWENPEIQELNRLPMRSPLLPFSSLAEALADTIAGPEFRVPEENEYYLDLNGVWRFKLLNNPVEDAGNQTVGDGFFTPDWVNPSHNVNDWTELAVPGAWTCQGFDKPHYTNVQMPFQATPPHTPKENPTGLYRRNFSLPAAWKKRRVVLHLGSAESCALIYVNGQFAGMGKDTRLPSEYDITQLVQEGENVLCVKVIRYSDATYIEDQDQWWHGGIHRSVFLYSTEACFIKDIKAVPGIVKGLPERKNPESSVPLIEELEGVLDFSVTLGGELPESRCVGNVWVKSEDETPFAIKYGLYPFALPKDKKNAKEIAANMEGNALDSGELILDPDYRANSHTARGQIRISNLKMWSHETPDLYVLCVSVFHDGRHIESAAFCTGFRNVQIKRRELLINERAVLIKGVNRHEHDEKNGKSPSIEKMMKDIKLLKTHNFNAVRTSHYPNDEAWYDLCDRYGIYLVDEANIEHHCFYDQLSWETAWAYAYAIRIQRMAERDKNHASIIIWSLGNESGDGANHNMGAAWIRRYDPSRPVNYEGAIRPENGQGTFTLDSLNRSKELTDIVGPMYPELELITDFVKYREDQRPLIMIEYSHAMGNSNGSLADYWKAIESHHGLQGGFIWEWIDHGFEAFSPDGVKYWKYGGDFGDLPTDYDFCCDGLLFPDQTPKPAMAECKQVFAPVRLSAVPGRPSVYILENRYDFSTLDSLALNWKLCTEKPGSGGEVLAQGSIDAPSLAPGEKTEIYFGPISLDDILVDNLGAVYFHVDFTLKEDAPWAHSGHVVAQAEHIVRDALPISLCPKLCGSCKEAPVFFAEGFAPSLFRAPLQNDGLKTFMHLRGEPEAEFYYYKKAMYPWLDLDLLHLRLTNEKTEDTLWEGRPAKRYTALLVAGKDAIDPSQNLGRYTCVTAFGQGPLVMDISFDLDPSLPELPKVGISAKVPAYYSNISWFGAGREESYPDRMAAAFLGEYHSSPEDLEVPYIVPQDNGNRSGVRRLTLSGDLVPPGKPASLTIRPESPVNFSVSRYTQENMFKALHTIDLVDLSAGEDGYYFLNLDMAQRGVGTSTCGPDTRSEYRLWGGLYRMKLYIY